MMKMIMKSVRKEHKCVVCDCNKDIAFIKIKRGKHKCKGYMCFDCFYKEVKELSEDEEDNR